MRKIAIVFILIAFANLNLFAQDLRKKAEESPLDCALYLLSKDENAVNEENLTRVFFEVGRFDDALRAIEFDESSSSKFLWLSFYGGKLIEQNKLNEANKFLTKAFALLPEEEWSDSNITEFVSSLIKLGRLPEVFETVKNQDDDEDKAKLLILIAENFMKTGQSEKLKTILPEAQKLVENPKDSEKLLQITLLYAKLKQFDKSREILKLIEPSDFSGSSEIEAENNRRELLFPLLRVHLELGEIEKAFEIWNQHNSSYFYEFSLFINDLIAYGYKDKAALLIFQMQSDKEQLRRDGNEVVEAYLKIGDIEKAIFISRTMSDDDDNFWQQNSFITLADRFIAEGKNEAALEILDFAFQRARKIVFQHEALQSIGASSGTRKVIYYRNIYNRLMKLREYKKAFEVINSISSDHELAKEFFAEHLVDFAAQQAKTLPRKKIYELLTKAQNIVKDEDDESDGYFLNIKILSADVYAQIGEKATAVKMLGEVLQTDEDFLISAGKVFEQNNLKADANMRRVLRQLIEDAE